MARNDSLALLKYTYTFIPTAAMIEMNKMVVLRKAAPIKTIKTDIPMSNTPVFNPLAYQRGPRMTSAPLPAATSAAMVDRPGNTAFSG
ncbi:hypothetical protein GCM10027169_31880 [Gordonia jinhuaensis]